MELSPQQRVVHSPDYDPSNDERVYRVEPQSVQLAADDEPQPAKKQEDAQHCEIESGNQHSLTESHVANEDEDGHNCMAAGNHHQRSRRQQTECNAGPAEESCTVGDY